MSTKYTLNPVLGRINSWFFKRIDGYVNYLFGSSKRALLKEHPSTVVEIGSGTGTNMRYLKRGTTLIAIEPNIYMHKNLRKSADKYGIHLEIKTQIGEAIDLPNDSYDFVISTLVLCTVENPRQCVHQIQRILKPGGTFVFIEHVKAKDGSLLSFIQNMIHKPWHWFFEGCHTNRDTRTLLETSGFSSLDIEAYNSYSPFIPIIPQIRGMAVK